MALLRRINWSAFVKLIRAEDDLTQNDLARQLGVTDQTVSNWEREENKPRGGVRRKLRKLAENLGIPKDRIPRGKAPTQTTISPSREPEIGKSGSPSPNSNGEIPDHEQNKTQSESREKGEDTAHAEGGGEFL